LVLAAKSDGGKRRGTQEEKKKFKKEGTSYSILDEEPFLSYKETTPEGVGKTTKVSDGSQRDIQFPVWRIRSRKALVEEDRLICVRV